MGAAVLCYGIYLIGKKEPAIGAIQIVIGAVAITMGILYLTVDGFATAFWIVIGILIALYGLTLTIFAIVDKK